MEEREWKRGEMDERGWRREELGLVVLGIILKEFEQEDTDDKQNNDNCREGQHPF